MAANYWTSTQRRNWQFSRETIAAMRSQLDSIDSSGIKQHPLPDLNLIFAYFFSKLNHLARKLQPNSSLPRQIPLGTALVYLRRFYLLKPFRHTNPFLALITAYYLSSKLEETPHHIRLILNESRQLFSGDLVIPNDVAKIGEMEFNIISEMQSQLIVHHPYKTLDALREPLSLTNEEYAVGWSAINDSYLTDLPLLVAPHIIAVAAIFLAVVTTGSYRPRPAGPQPPSLPARPGGAEPPFLSPEQLLQNPNVQRIVTFLGDSEIDIEAVVESTQELLSFWSLMAQVPDGQLEPKVRGPLEKLVKERGLYR